MALANLPASLARTANRRAIPRKSQSPNLLAAAQRGELTRSNTRAGTAGRQAVDRATYQRRQAIHPHLTARQAVGQKVAGERLPVASFFGVLHGAPALIGEVTVSRRDASRIGKYLNLVEGLLDGTLSKKGFQDKVKRWAPIKVLDPAWGPVDLVKDADTVIALATQTSDAGFEGWMDSGRRRMPQRTRTVRK